jgi:hypothetical protein
MSIGDIVSVHSSITNGSYLTIQPSGTTEWGIQNIYIPYGTECELYRTDGTNEILLKKITDTIQFTQPINPTLTIYFRVKNVSGSSVYLGYDGKVSKE